jgi:hypothetical protein
VIDWDGTLVPDAWPDKPREWEPGAREALRDFIGAGYEVRIHSCRTHSKAMDGNGPNTDRLESLAYIEEMLVVEGFKDVEVILDNKPSADLYIDNKGLRYDGNWARIARRVME